MNFENIKKNIPNDLFYLLYDEHLWKSAKNLNKAKPNIDCIWRKHGHNIVCLQRVNPCTFKESTWFNSPNNQFIYLIKGSLDFICSFEPIKYKSMLVNLQSKNSIELNDPLLKYCFIPKTICYMLNISPCFPSLNSASNLSIMNQGEKTLFINEIQNILEGYE